MKFKHARAARGLLQDLEEDIRRFVLTWNEKQARLQKEGQTYSPSPLCEEQEEEQDHVSDDDDDDEIVFVGRKGKTHDAPDRRRLSSNMSRAFGTINENHEEKMVFESLVGDRGAGFG